MVMIISVVLKMAKEDILLQEEMGRLEIEPLRVSVKKSENPFHIQAKTGFHTRPQFQSSSCTCLSQKRNKITGIFKKKNKVINEPVLQIIKGCISNLDKKCQPEDDSDWIDSLNLCTLVTTCNQLKISSDSKEQNGAAVWNNEKKWWKHAESSKSRENKEVVQHSQTASCSQQALNPPCDITIDELASYFETLVHIPKKMSSMAEMMYI